MKVLFSSLLLSALLISACKNQDVEKPQYGSGVQIEFDQAKWNEKDKMNYPYRDQMLDDIINSKLLKTISRQEIIDLMGPPTKIDTNYLFYRIAQQRIGFFPLHTKTLVIELSQDSTENRVLIHE